MFLFFYCFPNSKLRVLSLVFTYPHPPSSLFSSLSPSPLSQLIPSCLTLLTPPFGLSSLPSSHVPRLTKLLSSFSYLSPSPSCPPFSPPPLSNLIPSSFSLLSNSLPTSYLVLRLPLSPLAPPLIPLLSFRPLVYLSTKYSPVALPSPTFFLS